MALTRLAGSQPPGAVPALCKALQSAKRGGIPPRNGKSHTVLSSTPWAAATAAPLNHSSPTWQPEGWGKVYKPPAKERSLPPKLQGLPALQSQGEGKEEKRYRIFPPEKQRGGEQLLANLPVPEPRRFYLTPYHNRSMFSRADKTSE